MATLSRLFIHPVKSMRGIGLTHALADTSGLSFDRIFMVTEADGTFIMICTTVPADGPFYSFSADGWPAFNRT